MAMGKEHSYNNNDVIIVGFGKAEFREQFSAGCIAFPYFGKATIREAAIARQRPQCYMGLARPDRRKSLLAQEIRNCIQGS
jgi:hypothetical protein